MTRSPFTLQQRHEIYEEALRIYKTLNNNKGYIGLCYSLLWVVNEFYPEFLTIADPFVALRELSGVYPEIEKQCPQPHPGDYWFPLDDKETRIKILIAALDETDFY